MYSTTYIVIREVLTWAGLIHYEVCTDPWPIVYVGDK